MHSSRHRSMPKGGDISMAEGEFTPDPAMVDAVDY
jgi:hypothetical protein